MDNKIGSCCDGSKGPIKMAEFKIALDKALKEKGGFPGIGNTLKFI